jgi:hypothetical protein
VLPVLTATRYITPLREGGSLPGLMEADDLGTYVVKFHGAGQGRKVLVAEVICARLARALGLPVPELALVEVDPLLAPAEPDEEVQDLLRRSAGLNLAVDGAALVFHHDWSRADASADRPYEAAGHALIRFAPAVQAAAAALAPLVTNEVLAAAVADVPDVWLADEEGFASPAEVRAAYVARLRARLDAQAAWLPPLAACAGQAPVPTEPPGRAGGRPAWLTGRPGAGGRAGGTA